MSDPTPKFPTSPVTPKKEDVFLGLRSKYFIFLMEQKVPGLYEKLSNLRPGEIPNLSESEKNFFVELVMDKTLQGVCNLIVDITEKIWGARIVKWKQFSKDCPPENIATAFWWHFCSPSLTHENAENLVNFYLGNTKEQALKEILKWPEWEGRDNVRLV